MFAVLLVSVIACLTAFAYWRWLQVKRFWEKRGVPHLPPNPIYGSLSFLGKVNPSIWMRQLYERFDSPYVGIWMFWRPALLVNCPALAQRILVKDFANFRDRFLSSSSHDAIGHLNVFTSKDPSWSNIRRRLTPVFTSVKLKAIQRVMITKSKELVQRIQKEIDNGNRPNLRPMFNDYSTDIIGIAAFGINSEATLTGTSSLRKVTKDFETFTPMRAVAWICIFFFPEMVRIFRFTFFPKAATDFFRRVFQAILEQRTKEGFPAEPRDLMDILIRMKQQSIEENNEMSDDAVVAQGAIMLQGGYDTSGSSLTFATYELAHHPHVQEKLYKEISEAKQKIGDADFDDNLLSQLPYLNCVIKEIFRKYQSMAWLDRVARNSYVIDENLTIPAGTPICINTAAMNYDPKYYEEPTKFDPERFMVEEVDRKGYYMPFGAGPRICIGKRFGEANGRTGLSAIVLNFELRAIPGTPKPYEVPLEKNSIFLIPGHPLYVDFVPRKEV